MGNDTSWFHFNSVRRHSMSFQYMVFIKHWIFKCKALKDRANYIGKIWQNGKWRPPKKNKKNWTYASPKPKIQATPLFLESRLPAEEAQLTWAVTLQQVPAIERPAFGVAHLKPLLQKPLGDVALTDTCRRSHSHTKGNNRKRPE